MKIRDFLNSRRKVYPAGYWQELDKRSSRIMFFCLAAVLAAYAANIAVWICLFGR